MKKHDILIEPWRGNPGPRSQRGNDGFRWTVSYERDGRFYAQGFADSHAEARAAAESYLKEQGVDLNWQARSEEHTSELQSQMRISYAVFRLKKKNTKDIH